MMFLKNDMINVNHKIKCTHESTSILRYIKKNPKQDNDKKTKKQNQKHPKTPTDCKLCMLTIPFPLGKPVRGFLANTHCHDKNTYVQTARSLIAVKRLYTQRCHYLTNMQEMEFPEFIAQNSNRHRLRLRGSLPCATA